MCVCVCGVDELPFEPREVVISPGRQFSEFYSVGEEIGRLTTSLVVLVLVLVLELYLSTFFVCGTCT